jgi:Tol biopolymer transport system component
VLTAADWSPNAGEIAFVRNDSLLVTPLAGGTPRLVTTTADLHSCVWSPNGKWLSCVKGNSVSVLPGTSFGNLAPSSVGLVPAAGGAWIDLTGSAGLNQNPAWASDSRRIFFVSNRDGPRDIYVQAIGSAGKPDGPAARLSTGLDAQSIGLSADDRRLTYAVYRASANIESVRFPANPPSGPEDPVALTAGNQIIEGAMPSHDGRWLVYDSDLKGNSNIWRIPAGGGTPEQLTSDPFDEFAADLSPDGRFVAYHAFRTPGLRQIEVKPLDGGPVERVTRDSLQESNPFWSPDGNSIAFFEITPPFRLSVAHREGPGRWSRRRQLAFGGGGRWSPDGKTLVFVTSGRERTLTGDVRLVTMPAD